MLLPDGAANPYQPDAILFALPVMVAPEPVEAVAPFEDELMLVTLTASPWAEPVREAHDVPEPSAGALLLTVVMLTLLWKVASR